MLRSLKDFERYTLAATDGDIGSISDFLIDEERWTVRCLVAKTGSFFDGRRTLVSPISFRHTDWSTKSFHVQLTMQNVKQAPSVESAELGGSRLRSVNELRGYRVHGSDGDVGHIEDLIVDDTSWQVRYVVVDTSNLPFGTRVLVAPHWASRVSWDERKVYFHMASEALRNSPTWKAGAAINSEYEARLFNYYGLPVYADIPGLPMTEQPAIAP